ncbi:hypothetical protein POM88_032048 [Heracleum sosnowskyi]|uniref:Uncharacterized protein n=1 Tax=Heracleum sosnowskyi TaxID=360622 RepID=A0AAD8MH73_9APIA|nr:hypothetical protein POM88_032048 [Heracleum sosnowskyi]
MPQDLATTLVMHFLVKRFAEKAIKCMFPSLFGAGPGGLWCQDIKFSISFKSFNVTNVLNEVDMKVKKTLENEIGAIWIEGVFSVIVTAQDLYRGKPDPEMYMYAAQLLHFLPERCIVFGNSNQTVEAAHDARMKCVAVASKHPVYELGAADLVVKRLDELSIVDLKNLADIDSPEFGEPELEMEFEHPCMYVLSVALHKLKTEVRCFSSSMIKLVD